MIKFKLVPLEPTDEMVAASGLEPILTCEVYRAMLAAAPEIEQEPVAWSGWGCQYPRGMPRLYGDRHIAELNCDAENGDKVLHFTATSQPALDVEGLMKMLAEAFPLWDEDGINEDEHHCEWNILQDRKRLHSVLAAYRKGGKL